MKRILAALLLLTLFAGCMPVLADPAPMGIAVTADLDGDGTAETVTWDMVEGEYDPMLTVTVESDRGATSYATEIIYAGSVYVQDLDGDGLCEILISGDVMSDDYCTYCLRYLDGSLYELLFPDGSRGDSSPDRWYRWGYGQVTAIEGNRISLWGSQDVLGTWFATREVTLTPLGRFEFCDDGIWVRDLSNMTEETWDYAALTLTASLPYTTQTGEAGILEPGSQILVYASDKKERVWFATPEGLTGMLSISPDYERGWGWLIDGMSEEDCFEFVPYAD